MRHCLLYFFALLCSNASNANPYLAEGFYSSSSTKLHLIILNKSEGVVAASTVVTQGACSGRISGIGKMVDNTVTLSAYTPQEEGGQCNMTIEFNSSFTNAKITEGDGCSFFHGAACGWEGQTVSKRKQ